MRNKLRFGVDYERNGVWKPLHTIVSIGWIIHIRQGHYSTWVIIEV